MSGYHLAAQNIQTNQETQETQNVQVYQEIN
jgi:hypothetical protein